jgi:hypothetical protein
MCFSADVSFIASAVILVIGVVSIIKARTIPIRIFALIPLFFAFQQFTEGLLWLVLANPDYDIWRPFLTHVYLSFAWVIWPVFIPFSMGLLENNAVRKKIMHLFLGIGIIVSACFIGVMIFYHAHALINVYHIDYKFDFKPIYPMLFTLLYLIATVIALLVSSIKYMWMFSIVNLVSYLFTRIYFAGHVVSIWCFFGALSSIIVLGIVLDRRALYEKEKKSHERITDH